MICSILMFLNLTVHPIDLRDQKTFWRAANKCAEQNECLSYFQKKEPEKGWIHYHALCKEKE